MKYLFIVQGEGRGHMTQSVALSEMLENRGHQVEKVCLGRSSVRDVPEFYRSRFPDKLCFFRSPNFIRTRDRKGINVTLSLIYNLLLAPLYIYEIFRLAKVIRKSEAGLIVNFYDMTGSLAHAVSFGRKKMVVLSHHFFFEDESFIWPPDHLTMRFLLRFHSRIVSIGAHTRVALSFTGAASDSNRSTVIAPPLLRRAVMETEAVNGDYILVYLLNEGFLDEIYSHASRYAGITWRIYTNCNYHPVKDLPNVELHEPSGDEFIDHLAGCRAVICTAGFETVCESAYLDKPIRLLPSKGHFEQLCNLHDAMRAGLAKEYGETFDPGSVLETGNETHVNFRKWVTTSEASLMAILEG